jgi:ribosomal protein L40E
MAEDEVSRGWLVNKDRRDRRDQPFTFTDEDCAALLERIDDFEFYISPKWGPEVDALMRLRDKALIATNWTFFNRAGEVLSLRRQNVYVSPEEVSITFYIEKKKKHYKICPDCGTKNGRSSNYCRKCRADLKPVEIVEEGGPTLMTKNKSLQFRFMPFLVDWLKELDAILDNHIVWVYKKEENCTYQEMKAKDEKGEKVLVFPPLRVHNSLCRFDFSRPLTIQRFDFILQRLDPKMTSCLFRYGGAEKYLRLRYSPYELKQVGGWSNTLMPERYAQRKGLSEAQMKWSDDLR